MFPIATACFDKDEAFCAFNVLRIERTALTMLHREVIHSPIDKLESREHFRQLPFYFLVQRLYVLELWESEHDVVGRLWCGGGKDGNTSHNAERSFRTNEELLQVITCCVT